MNKVYFMFLLVFVSCSSSNDDNIPDNEENQPDEETIVGSWDFVRGGVVYEDGSEEITNTDCSNSQIFRFFEGGSFEVEIWWTVDGVCTFDQIRDGNWLKTTNSDYPGANYRLRFFEIPDDDEEIGYGQITFEDINKMRIQYIWETSSDERITHRFYEYKRE